MCCMMRIQTLLSTVMVVTLSSVPVWVVTLLPDDAAAAYDLRAKEQNW